MANPFLILGGIAVSVVAAGIGVLAVPGWVAAAQDSAAIEDLAQVAAVESAAITTTGSYFRTIGELEDGASLGGAGVKLQRSAGVKMRLSVSEQADAWCAVTQSAAGDYFARSHTSTEALESSSADDAAAAAGCLFSWADSPDSDDLSGVVDSAPEPVVTVPTATPTPLPTVNPDDKGEQYPGFEPGIRNPAGIITAGADTIITGVNWVVPNMGPSQPTCVEVDIVGEHEENRKWSFSLQRNGAPFYGDDQYWYATSTQVKFDIRDDEVIVTGIDNWGWNPDWSNAYLNSARPLSMTVCATPDLPPTVLYGDAWYALSQERSGEWTDTKACVALTATGKVDFGEYPFRYGWAGIFDLREAKQHILSAGKTLNWVEFTPSPSSGYQFVITSDDTTKPVLDRYDVASGWMLPLLGDSSQTITACVHGY